MSNVDQFFTVENLPLWRNSESIASYMTFVDVFYEKGSDANHFSALPPKLTEFLHCSRPGRGARASDSMQIHTH